MMTADISSQVADLRADFRKYSAKVYTGVARAVRDGCLDVEREAKASIVGPSDEVSTPGDPPKIKTGRLRASITNRIKEEGEKVVGEVGTNVEYAEALEYGTSAMAPRPFLGPAYDKKEAAIMERIKKAEDEASGELEQ